MTPQIPLGSGFGFRTTARDVLGDRRLDGLHLVITGGSAGVGLETTRACAGAGAHVRVGARSLAKAQAVLAGVANVEIDSLDLADPASIDAFAARTLLSGHPVHVLLNNAGIMAVPLSRDARVVTLSSRQAWRTLRGLHRSARPRETAASIPSSCALRDRAFQDPCPSGHRCCRAPMCSSLIRC